ncbi:hypothetical protein MKX03_005276, partial [Papaver bracteatum]
EDVVFKELEDIPLDSATNVPFSADSSMSKLISIFSNPMQGLGDREIENASKCLAHHGESSSSQPSDFKGISRYICKDPQARQRYYTSQ